LPVAGPAVRGVLRSSRGVSSFTRSPSWLVVVVSRRALRRVSASPEDDDTGEAASHEGPLLVCMMDSYRNHQNPRTDSMEATVAERGQITLPKAVRDALGLTKGTKLKVELEGGRVVLRKDVDDALSRVRGRFKLDGFASTDEALRAIRGHAPGDPYLPPEDTA
jgi:AbrB family looped-hinge helix DNA binding protein